MTQGARHARRWRVWPALARVGRGGHSRSARGGGVGLSRILRTVAVLSRLLASAFAGRCGAGVGGDIFWKSISAPVQGVLAGMMFRMGLPLVAVIAIPKFRRPAGGERRNDYHLGRVSRGAGRRDAAGLANGSSASRFVPSRPVWEACERRLTQSRSTSHGRSGSAHQGQLLLRSAEVAVPV